MAYYRNELKYLVTEAQIAQLECRLGGILQQDRHAMKIDRPGKPQAVRAAETPGKTQAVRAAETPGKPQVVRAAETPGKPQVVRAAETPGKPQASGPAVAGRSQYLLRSLYFDDYEDSCYLENMSGCDPREKWRIRIYGHSDEAIFLEKKSKIRGKTHKDRCLLTRGQAMQLIRGEEVTAVTLTEERDRLLREFIVRKNLCLFKPAVITVYERIPYVYRMGNVRITLDRNISSSCDFENFFEERIALRPILPAGLHLLEVKYDEFLPRFIFQSLQMEGLRRTSFSKYCLCRKYGL